MWVTEILCSFKLVLEGKTGKEILQSSRLEFLEKFSENNFALLDSEDNNPELLNIGGEVMAVGKTTRNGVSLPF